MLISTEAISLKTIPYSESSLIVRLFTSEQGKVTVIAKGVRKPKNPTGAILEPMNLLNVEFYYKDSREIQTLKEASLAFTAHRTHQDLVKMSLGLVVIEIIDKVLAQGDPALILFRLTGQVLRNLETTEHLDHLLLAFFMLQLAIHTGFKPNLSQCSKCGNSLSHAVFNGSTGDLECRSCSLAAGVHLQEKDLELLRYLSATHIEKLSAGRLARTDIDRAVNFLSSFLDFHQEGMRKIKSLEVIRQLGV